MDQVEDSLIVRGKERTRKTTGETIIIMKDLGSNGLSENMVQVFMTAYNDVA